MQEEGTIIKQQDKKSLLPLGYLYIYIDTYLPPVYSERHTLVQCIDCQKGLRLRENHFELASFSDTMTWQLNYALSGLIVPNSLPIQDILLKQQWWSTWTKSRSNRH